MILTPPILCLITDRRRLAERLGWGSSEPRTLAALVDQLVAGSHAGVQLVQIREADLTGRELIDLVRHCRTEVATTTRIVVNDRLDVAVAAADGVHLKGSSVPTAAARQLLDRSRLIGRSFHDARQLSAEVPELDYGIFGSVFPTRSKPANWPVTGVDGLAAAVRAAGSCPVLAIGGIRTANAGLVRAAGAAGIAAIDAFLPSSASALAESVQLAVRDLRKSFDSTVPLS